MGRDAADVSLEMWWGEDNASRGCAGITHLGGLASERGGEVVAQLTPLVQLAYVLRNTDLTRSVE